MIEQRHTVCRICQVACDLIATIEDGKILSLHGNKDNPVYHGYSCIKGRSAGDLLNAPSRLLHSKIRQPDGTFRNIESSQAIESVAERLKSIIDKHGPRSVALFAGTYCTISPLFDAFAKSFMRCIGSPMVIDNITIDQPGTLVATGMHGTWLAGTPPMDEWEALLLVGANPIVSMNGGLGVNPARQLKRMRERGAKLVVVDPRRTECARHADVHLQCRPGEDATIRAGEQAVVPDAMEATRQDVEQEPPDKLVGGERHDALALGPVAAIVLVAERDAAPRRTRSAGGSRWRRGGCSGIDRRALPAARRTAAWHRPPSASSGPGTGDAGTLAGRPGAPLSPKNASRPASCSWISRVTKMRRNSAPSTRTGRRNAGRDDIQRAPSGAMPPPGTIICTCGWWVIAEPQVWSTAVIPIRAPRCLGSAAIVSIVSDAARNSRS